MLMLSIAVGLIFALVLGGSMSWLFLKPWIKKGKYSLNQIMLLIASSILFSLVTVAFSFIAIWPPYDILSLTLIVILFIVLISLGFFIASTYSSRAISR